ncbi:hypothetical protein Ahy_A04g018263 isoform C [Arachis hypogaea]|uniref:Uncharacterized protein n=1 Tax=Arachis hypogaea TaxID=3818 RepID=A0A445DDA4_ARAHY|nr:hypothetical protein Ahy_A04g018263 isoform C [Arachis hypogaea]
MKQHSLQITYNDIIIEEVYRRSNQPEEKTHITGDEISLLPNIAEEIVNILMTKKSSAVKPVGAENANIEMYHLAGGVEWVEGVVEGGAIVPFKVVGEDTQLVLDDVEVAAVGPVVP